MANPDFSIDASSHDDLGYSIIRWTNATKGANWYSWRVKRRLIGGAWVTLHETVVDQANYQYNDGAVPQNVEVEYAVIRVFLSGGTPTEEAATPRATFAPGNYYWLAHPSDVTKSVCLRTVTSDQFEDDYDFEVHRLIGRGRKIDQGTKYGIQGELEAQLRDRHDQTAAQQLAALLLLKEQQTFVLLKNPFGAVLKVGLDQIEVNRIAGVGLNEYTDVSFGYMEVA